MKGTSPVQRTMRCLREKGNICAVVEKWNAYGGEHGIRVDLFGILDIIVLDPVQGVIGVQACGSDFAGHIRKLTEEHAQETIDWLSTPGTKLQVWGWRRVKLHKGGKAMRWMPRIQEITLNEIGVKE